MITNEQARGNRHQDHGVSIMIIAVSMIFVLGMAGLAIDLASLYVARSQAQRAADAAALAAANSLASPDNGCLDPNGGTLSSTCETVATQQAEVVGNQNLIAGQVPNIGQVQGDITFISESTIDPQVKVIAARDTAHGNPMPTFFVKIFGIDTANISASAVAEAYVPSSNGLPVGTKCVKPWLIPNCDPGNLQSVTGQYNPNCAPGSGGNVGGFVTVGSGGNSISTTLARPDSAPPNGPIGEPVTLKPGSPGGAAAPGQYYAAFLPNSTSAPTECPACSNSSPTSGGTGSAAIYRENIECCNQNPIYCGPTQFTIASSAGNMVGPTAAGVDCLIHQSGNTFNGGNCGQDTLNGTTNPCVSQPPPIMQRPFVVKGGPNNPYNQVGLQITPSAASDSVVTVPIWDGTPLQSGQNSNVLIVGFLRIFIQNEDRGNQGTVYGTVMDVTTCGSGGSGSGSGGAIQAPGGSPVPVRLIHE